MVKSGNTPLYTQIYKDIKAKIRSGAYPVNSLIPPEKSLIEEYGVSRITIQNALKMLVNEDLIKRRPGVGTVVLSEPEEADQPHFLGLIMSGFLESFGNTLLNHLSLEASKRGYFLIVKFANEDQTLEKKYTDELINLPVDGLLIDPVQRAFYDSKLVSYILRGKPIVVIDKALNGIDSLLVSTDHYGGALQCANYLIKRGHRKIRIFSYKIISNSSLDRRVQAFRHAYAEAGWPLDEHALLARINSNYRTSPVSTLVERDVNTIKESLLNDPPTCVVVLESYLAYLTRRALRELKWRVPQDISFFGFDSNSFIYSSDNYTYLEQNEPQIAETAIDLLLRYVNEQAITRRQIFIPSSIREHGTVKNLVNPEDQEPTRWVP
ncbi:GntR family transcriptional regulator [Lacticaseibacillus kribbianus]|uniref:GntR family transcriptional regulator n=1 Tax=Lacticaseibacillus kribbianus TaxID=2926292 RepID=UPI001CD23068|nr:GntR family transcriptional regulator [Lacticaseibacillus kribbianus]